MYLIGGAKEHKRTSLQLPILITKFLAYDHGWRPNTLMINKNSLNHYLKKGFPANKSYRAMVTRCLTDAINGGMKKV